MDEVTPPTGTRSVSTMGVLAAAGLEHLAPNFESNGVEPWMITSLSDSEMASLGVTRVGDRVKLRRFAEGPPAASSAEERHRSKSAMESNQRLVDGAAPRGGKHLRSSGDALPAPSGVPGTVPGSSAENAKPERRDSRTVPAASGWPPPVESPIYTETFYIECGMERAWDALCALAREHSVVDQTLEYVVFTRKFYLNRVTMAFRKEPSAALCSSFSVAYVWHNGISDPFGFFSHDFAGLSKRVAARASAPVRRLVPERSNPYLRMTVAGLIVVAVILGGSFAWRKLRPGAEGIQSGDKVCACFRNVKRQQEDGELPPGVGGAASAFSDCVDLWGAELQLNAPDKESFLKFNQTVNDCVPELGLR